MLCPFSFNGSLLVLLIGLSLLDWDLQSQLGYGKTCHILSDKVLGDELINKNS